MRQALLAALVVVPALFAVGCEKLPAVPAAPNVPPTASFFYNPVAPINAGETTVTFNAVASRDTDGEIVQYLWNFGDGTPEVATAGPTVAHVFPDTAARCIDVTYAVLLTVTDNAGEKAYANQAVRVTELPLPTSNACR